MKRLVGRGTQGRPTEPAIWWEWRVRNVYIIESRKTVHDTGRERKISQIWGIFEVKIRVRWVKEGDPKVVRATHRITVEGPCQRILYIIMVKGEDQTGGRWNVWWKERVKREVAKVYGGCVYTHVLGCRTLKCQHKTFNGYRGREKVALIILKQITNSVWIWLWYILFYISSRGCCVKTSSYLPSPKSKGTYD